MVARLLLAVGASAGNTGTLANATPPGGGADEAPLLPRRVAQLRWLGLSAASLRLLEPYIAVLPTHTQLNLNTASAEAISASVPALSLVDAKRMVAERGRRPFQNLAQAGQSISATAGPLDSGQLAVATHFFEVRGRLRMEKIVVEERSLVQRNGIDVTVLWRERAAVGSGAPFQVVPAAGAGREGGVLTMRP